MPADQPVRSEEPCRLACSRSPHSHGDLALHPSCTPRVVDCDRTAATSSREMASRNSWADDNGSAWRPSAPKVARQLAATAASVISDWTSTGWPVRAELIAANNKALHCRLSM